MARPTMADIAARAGVTVATVSRALSDRASGALREETVARVLAVADELGYRPNTLARGLRTQRSYALGMLVPDLTNPFMPPVVRAVEDVLADAGYTLIVVNTDNDARREAQSIEMLVGRRVDGLVLATAHLGEDWLHGDPMASLPVVLVNRRSRLPLPTVVPDDRQGVRLVVEHLVGLGHRRVGHVAGPQEISTGRARAEAFESAVTRAGIHEAGSTETTARLAVDDGYRACIRLLGRCRDMTAIFAGNDLLAVGCLRALRERGLRVPDDMSLVGFNDMQLVDLLDPPLTTVRIPQYEMGRRAAELLLSLLAETAPPRNEVLVELAGELIVRGSTAAPSR